MEKKGKSKVAAVIVTYNRKLLLKECLDAVYSQTVSVERVILVDNASNDGTKEMLHEQGFFNRDNFQYELMHTNLGGAGGFYEGIKIAEGQKFGWIWIMDDDTIPTEKCLEELLSAHSLIKEGGTENKIAFLASTVYGPEGEFMNLPSIDNRQSPNGYEYWYQYLKDGIVYIKSATFVSILINSDAVKHCGLPCKDYFLWGDDNEYTLRLAKYFGDGFFVGRSIAIHKRAGSKALDINDETDVNRIKRYWLLYRNTLINGKYYNPNFHPYYRALKYCLSGFNYIGKPNGFIKFKAIIKGNISGLISFNKFKRYIESQIRE